MTPRCLVFAGDLQCFKSRGHDDRHSFSILEPPSSTLIPLDEVLALIRNDAESGEHDEFSGDRICDALVAKYGPQ